MAHFKRELDRTYTPQPAQGFLGRGHTARPVISGSFQETDPFILLMDDFLDKKDNEPVGGPHPHAGFETVSLLLEGEIGDENHTMKGGDFQIMTAGSGIVHTETIDKIATMRLLQLWVNLPKKDRWTLPRVQDLPLGHVPSILENGMQIKLYSGSLSGQTSPVQNYVPMIIADISIEPGRASVLQIPANYNGFLYLLQGRLDVGEQAKQLEEFQVGWLNRFENDEESEMKLRAGEGGARFILYAGKPTGDQIISHGPFIADTSEDIQRLYRDYRLGKMEHISTVHESQRILL